jgi:outer membrane protein
MRSKDGATVRSVVIVVILFLSLCGVSGSMAALEGATDEIQVGLLFNASSDMTDRFTATLSQEIDHLLGKQNRISLPESKHLVAKWSRKSILENYAALVNDPDVDIIVAAGPLCSAVLAQEESFPKPLILIGILDYELQQIPLTADKSSGRHNLTYLLETRDFSADLDNFYEIYPYRKLVFLADEQLLGLLPEVRGWLNNYVAGQGSDLEIISYEGDIDLLLEKISPSAGFDAVFMGGLFSLKDSEKQRLIDHVNKLELPSYAFLGLEDVKRGILAGASPETNWQKAGRRIALNIEQIIDGRDPAELKTLLEFSSRLTLNMQTAKQIDFSPNWSTLAKAELIAVGDYVADRKVNFRMAVEEALQANLNLDIERKTLASAVEDVFLTRAQLLPSLSAGIGLTRIDDEHAGVAQAEQTTTASLTLSQLLYSDSAWANLAARKHQAESAREGYRQVVLDTVLNAGQNYLNILKAKSTVRTNRNNLALVKKNYEVAEYRRQIGYAGAADVYRLDSELATATSQLISAQSRLKQAKIELNDFLKRPLSEDFSLQEVGLETDLLSRYGSSEIRDAVNNPKDLERLTLFLTQEAVSTVPEIKQLRASLAAQERLLKSQQRKRWLPIVNLSASVNEVLDRDGVGSTPAPAEDTSWNLNLNANWDLFAGGGINSEIRQAQIERNKLNKQLEQTGRLVEKQLRNAMLDLLAQESDLELTQTAAEAAEKNYQLVQDSYRKGAATITALLDAQNSALSADQSAESSVYDFYLAILQVERAMGSFSLTSNADEKEDFYQRLKKYMNASLR